MVSSSAIVADDCYLPGEEEPGAGTGWSVLQEVSEEIHTSHGNVIVRIRKRVKYKTPQYELRSTSIACMASELGKALRSRISKESHDTNAKSIKTNLPTPF